MSLDSSELKRAQHRNSIQTIMLIFIMGTFMWLLAQWLFGASAAFYTVSFILVFLALNPLLPPEILLNAYRAYPIRQTQSPELYQITLELAQRAGLSHPPQLYYLPVGTMNAFAIGSYQQPVIALSDGLLRHLNLGEIAAVLSHEISHIKHRDIKIMMLSDLIGQLIRLFSLTAQIVILLSIPGILFGAIHINLLALLCIIFAPLGSAMLQLAISRRREILADVSAAQLMGTAWPLISALDKLDRQGSYWERLYRASSDNAWLRTHPKTSERISQLKALELPGEELLAYKRDWSHPWQHIERIPPRKFSRFFWF